MNPALTDEEKAHKVLEGYFPCCKCGEFWESPEAMIEVRGGDVPQHWCLFCYIRELEIDIKEIKCKSPLSALAVPSSGMATALSPMKYLTLLESMFGYRTRARLRSGKAGLP